MPMPMPMPKLCLPVAPLLSDFVIKLDFLAFLILAFKMGLTHFSWQKNDTRS